MAETTDIEVPEVADEQQQQPQNPAPPQDTPDKKLWEQLNKSHLYTKDYGSFQKQFSNPKAIDDLYNHLNGGNLYTKDKDAFYNQFFKSQIPTPPEHHLVPETTNHDIDHLNDIQGSEDFLKNYIGSPNAVKAIDKITEEAANKDWGEQLKNQGSAKQDATYRAQPIPIRLPDMIKDDRNNLINKVIENPQLINTVLEKAKKVDPNNAVKISRAQYVTAAAKRGTSPAVTKYNADQISQGNYEYNGEKDALYKKEGIVDSFMRGISSHSKMVDRYDFLKSHNDADIIKELESENKNYEPDKPQFKPSGDLASFSEGLGSNAIPMAKMVGTSTVLGLAPESIAGLAPILSSMYGASDFHHTTYANVVTQTYHELRNKGLSPEDALIKAKDNANFAANLAYGQGVIMGMAGGKLGKTTEFTPVRYNQGFIKALGDIAKNSKNFAKEVVPEMGVQSGIAAGTKAIENAHEGKPAGEGTVDAAIGIAMYVGGLMALRGGGITKAAKNNLLEGYSKSPDYVVNAALAKALHNNPDFTVNDAAIVKNEIAAHKIQYEGKLDELSPISADGQALLKLVDDGAKVTHINANLLRIAKENGIEAKGEEEELTPQKIINGLRERQESIKLPKTYASAQDKFESDAQNLTGINKEMYAQDPEGFLKFIADQVHSGNREEIESANGVTKDMVDLAIEKYPEHVMKTAAPPKVVMPSENRPPEIATKEQAEANQKAQIQKNTEIEAAHKPEPLSADFLNEKELLDSKAETRIEHRRIKGKVDILNKIIDCVWA